MVFIIGMRINRLRNLRQWVRVARRMGPMVRELKRSPAKGLLHVESCFTYRTTVMVQYWRSYDDLEHFARDAGDLHWPAWQAYNRSIRKTGDAGVYHETYKVRAGEYEAVYVNMPAFGLGVAGRSLPTAQVGDRSRERITRGPEAQPTDAVETYNSKEEAGDS